MFSIDVDNALPAAAISLIAIIVMCGVFIFGGVPRPKSTPKAWDWVRRYLGGSSVGGCRE
jgi:hypothetical protein